MTLPVPVPDPLPRPVIDSHCHLDIIADYSGLQPARALEAAAQCRVVGTVQVGVDIGSSHRSVALAHEFPGVVAAVGIHPNEAPTRADSGHLGQDLATLAELATDPAVCAIGETGLDHYRTDGSGHEQQKDSFREHIRLARALGKTLVIHDRDAHDDVFRVLETEDLPDRVVFHCFSGDAEMASHCADAGWYMSFAGVVTFRNAQSLRDALANVPDELLLVETDAPFLTPMPNRGRPNAPYLLPWTVMTLAELLEVGLAAMCDRLNANTIAAFDLDPSFGQAGQAG